MEEAEELIREMLATPGGVRVESVTPETACRLYIAAAGTPVTVTSKPACETLERAILKAA